MRKMYKRLFCKSGFNMSVQASDTSYSNPRDNQGPYTEVEVGFPSAVEPMIIGYAEAPDDPTGTVYGWVPVGILKALIVKHGGVESGETPPFDMNVAQSAILAEALLEVTNDSKN